MVKKPEISRKCFFRGRAEVSPNPSRCLQPLNTPQEHTSEQPKLILANIRQHIVGNSRTTRYSEFDPRLSAEGDSGANLEKLKTNIEALKLEPQLTYMIYVSTTYVPYSHNVRNMM